MKLSLTERGKTLGKENQEVDLGDHTVWKAYLDIQVKKQSKQLDLKLKFLESVRA